MILIFYIKFIASYTTKCCKDFRDSCVFFFHFSFYGSTVLEVAWIKKDELFGQPNMAWTAFGLIETDRNLMSWAPSLISISFIVLSAVALAEEVRRVTEELLLSFLTNKMLTQRKTGNGALCCLSKACVKTRTKLKRSSEKEV